MLVHIKLLLTALFWGGTFIAGRIVARHVDPFSGAFLRFFIASIFLFLITKKAEGGFLNLDKKQIWAIILLGITGVFAYNVFFFSGLKHIEAGRAAIIIATNPIFIGFFSAYFFKEKLSIFKILGIFISVSGAIIVITRGSIKTLFQGQFGVGEFFISMCVVSWVSYSLIGKRVMVHLSPLKSVTYSIFFGTIALLVPATFKGLFIHIIYYPPQAWISLFYLAIFGTVLGFLWYYEGINIIGPMKASIYINFVPISAIIFAFFILDEPITSSLLIGTFCVIAGVYLTNFTAFRFIRKLQKK
jgi:drug/metabolite transporter (DMT)-like permease